MADWCGAQGARLPQHAGGGAARRDRAGAPAARQPRRLWRLHQPQASTMRSPFSPFGSLLRSQLLHPFAHPAFVRSGLPRASHLLQHRSMPGRARPRATHCCRASARSGPTLSVPVLQHTLAGRLLRGAGRPPHRRWRRPRQQQRAATQRRQPAPPQRRIVTSAPSAACQLGCHGGSGGPGWQCGHRDDGG